MGQQIVPPTSFRDFSCFMMQVYQDAIVIVWSKGILDVFLTFICNLNSQEIVMELKPNQTTSDRTNLVTLVFQMKVKTLSKGVAKIGWFA